MHMLTYAWVVYGHGRVTVEKTKFYILYVQCTLAYARLVVFFGCSHRCDTLLSESDTTSKTPCLAMSERARKR